MVQDVSDVRSSPNDQIAHAAKALGKSPARHKVFDFIYRGKKKRKTIDDVIEGTGLSRVRALQEAKKLSKNKIIAQSKNEERVTAYAKDDFFDEHKKKIKTLALNPEKLARYPTKTSHATTTIRVVLPAKQVRIVELTVEDIDSFKKTRKIYAEKYCRIKEAPLKRGLLRILKAKGIFKDWGGELFDLMGIIKYQKANLRAVFALKGPGTKGKLVPGKMGKQGDQIQRLFRAPAQAFFIQYGGQIEHTVLEQMKTYAQALSYAQGRTIYYGVIDGQDTDKLVHAYSIRNS